MVMLYKYMKREIYKYDGFEVGGAYLVHIGPGDEEATLIKVKDMREYIHQYFDGVK